MKLLTKITPLLFLATAVCVAAGAVFVSLKAGVQDETAESPKEPLTPVIVDAEGQGTAGERTAPAKPTVIDDETLDPDAVNHGRQHHVVLNANGGFEGSLSALVGLRPKVVASAGVKVRFVRDGKVLTTVVTDVQGRFSVTGLSDGVVSLIATSHDSLLLYAVRLVEPDNDEIPAADRIELVSSVVVSGENLSTAKSLISSALPKGDIRFATEVNETEKQYPFGTGEPGTTLNHHQVQLRPDGSLTGQVNVLDTRTGKHREVVDLKLHFLNGGKIFATTRVKPDGSFRVADINVGQYALVSTGTDGILAVGIEVIGAFANRDDESTYKLASVAQSLELAASPVTAADLNQDNADQVTDGNISPSLPATPPPPTPPPSPPGGIAGGTAPTGGTATGTGTGGAIGGGSGAGGGSALGPVIGAIAGGALGYGLASDDKPPATRAR